MEKRQHFAGSLLRSLVVTRRAEFPVAALCILAATTFWFLNALNKEYTTQINYPVIFDYDRENLVATEPLPQKLALNVTGYGWTLLRKSLNIDTRPVIFRIENPLKTRYLTAAALLPDISNQIKEAHVNFVENDTIAVAFDRKLAKTVALRADSVQIELRQNHLLTTPVRISPDSVTFTGPAALVRKLPDVLILNVPGKEIDENYEDEVAINYTQDP
nr:hypothetical protein [Cytophagales bacterium]